MEVDYKICPVCGEHVKAGQIDRIGLIEEHYLVFEISTIRCQGSDIKWDEIPDIYIPDSNSMES